MGIYTAIYRWEVGCCTHRLRRVCTGLRNTDITGAHGLVIHGFLLFKYLILCAFGTDFKGFWRASSPRCLRSPTSDAQRPKSFKIAPKALLNPNVIGIRIREWPIRVHPWYPCSLDPCPLAVGGGHTKSHSPMSCYFHICHSIFQKNLFLVFQLSLNDRPTKPYWPTN